MTSQANEKNALVLKDELAKMAREASPGAWIRDAHPEIESWRLGMPGADRMQLSSTLSEDGKLELRASDGWGRTMGIALYSVDERGVRFRSGRPDLMPNDLLADEQAFISHLLQLLRNNLAKNS